MSQPQQCQYMEYEGISHAYCQITISCKTRNRWILNIDEQIKPQSLIILMQIMQCVRERERIRIPKIDNEEIGISCILVSPMNYWLGTISN